MNSLYLVSSALAVSSVLAYNTDDTMPKGIQQNKICDPSMQSVWFADYHEKGVNVDSKLITCYSGCKSTTNKMADAGDLDNTQELCCSYIEWQDGSKSCDLKKGKTLQSQSSNKEIVTSAALDFTVDDVLNPKSSLFGWDFSVSTVNFFMTLLAWGDAFQDLTILIALMVTNTAVWVQVVILFIFLIDLFSIYVSTFHAPLGIKSVALEVWLLSAIHIMDLIFDYGCIIMFIYAAIHFSNDEFLIGTIILALPVLAANYLSLYYTIFDYEKDHSTEYDIDDTDKYI